MKFNEKNEQKDRLIRIKNLYVNKKYDALIKEATIYLSITPNELNVRFMRSKAYRKKEMYEKAINDLNYNLSLGENDHSLVELYFLYYYLNMYEKALELLPRLYERRVIVATSLVISEIVMKKSMGMSVKTKENNYVINQINNYDENIALKHISKHAANMPVISDTKSSRFNENLNLKYLYDIVTDNIKNSKKANVQEILEVHYFSVPNVGYSMNSVCHFIKVVVIPNTNKIISIYPIDNIYDSKFIHLDCDRDKLFKETQKVKTNSKIDKFKKRYNM